MSLEAARAALTAAEVAYDAERARLLVQLEPLRQQVQQAEHALDRAHRTERARIHGVAVLAGEIPDVLGKCAQPQVAAVLELAELRRRYPAPADGWCCVWARRVERTAYTWESSCPLHGARHAGSCE